MKRLIRTGNIAHNRVIVRGSQIHFDGAAWLVSGWNETKNEVYLARDDTIRTVKPSDVRLDWSEQFRL